MRLPLALIFLLSAAGCATKHGETSFKPVSIVPKPVHVTAGDDSVQWDGSVLIIAKSDDEKQVAGLLKEYLGNDKLKVTIAESGDEEDKITLSTSRADSLGTEGYHLTVNGDGVAIAANSGAGLFYGVTSLLQIIDGNGSIPFVEITDYPRFPYRGLHLDVGRHMFPPAFIKKYIDLLALHKMNRFHWHLTEDQGWRIEIKKYPRLQEVASLRKETVVGHSSRKRQEEKYDGKPYGGFYTQDEIKDIVQYAAQRHVTIVPEIEMPGHALAALTAYPNLGCTGGPYQVGTTWGIFPDVFCAGKEDTFIFLQNVLDEVIALFPGEYIHIGGDECPKVRWEKCPYCQKRIKTEHLKDEHELQSYFIHRIEKYINSKGRKIIGWDEILEGGLAPNATVMSWRGEEGGIAAAKENHDVIMTPSRWCYLDKYQDTTGTEPLAIGGYLPVSRVYSYEPVPPQLSPDEAKHILGAQGNVWTEYIPTTDHVEYMVYPRASAMAEVVWSPKESRDYDDFLQRMGHHLKYLDRLHVNYAKHIEKEIRKDTSPAMR